MSAWNNFFLQKMGYSTGTTPYPVKESVASWGVWCKSIPFKILDKVKDPAKRNWYDQHGDDEYMPSEGLYIEAYTMKVEFGIRSTATSSGGTTIPADKNVRDKMQSFIDYLRTSGMMKMYSSYTRVGRQYVRLEAINDNAKWQKGEDGYWFLIFEMTFKVNDPVTDITLSA